VSVTQLHTHRLGIFSWCVRVFVCVLWMEAHLRRLLACGLWLVACHAICGTAIVHLDIVRCQHCCCQGCHYCPETPANATKIAQMYLVLSITSPLAQKHSKTFYIVHLFIHIPHHKQYVTIMQGNLQFQIFKSAYVCTKYIYVFMQCI